MKLPVLSFLALAASVGAKNLDSFPGYHKLDFKITRGSSFQDSSVDKFPRLVKRASPDGTVITVLENQSSFYSTTLKIGSNNEEIIVLVDTGSSDLWVSSSGNPYCASNARTSNSKIRIIDDAEAYAEITGSGSVSKLYKRDAWRVIEDDDSFTSIVHPNNNNNDDDKADIFASKTVNKAVTTNSVTPAMATIACDRYGTFNYQASKSFKSNDTEFFILYGDRTYALGNWGYDNVNIDGLQVDNLSFAVANQSNSSMGVLGIGLIGLETTNSGALSGNKPYTYSNLPIKLVEDGLIKTPAYSLYLNQVDQEKGNIIFGGVDHAKYEGDLQVVPIVNTLRTDTPIKLEVTLDSITLNSDSQSIQVSNQAVPALLDSGTTLTYLPQTIIASIASSVGARYSREFGYYLMACPTNSNLNITYNFQGININVPLTDVVLQADQRGTTCALAMMASDKVILGDSFLRSAYVVYDLKNYQIGLAQAKYTDQEDIEVITDTIPRAKNAASYSATASGSDSGSGDTALIGPSAVSISITRTRSGSSSATATAQATASSTRGSSTSKGDAGSVSNCPSIIGVALMLLAPAFMF